MQNFPDNQELQLVKKRNLVILFLMNLIQGFGFSLFSVVYQPFLFQITGSTTMIGLIVTIGGIMQFLPQHLAGKFSDRHGRKIMIGIGLLVIAVGLIPLSFSTSLIFVVIGSVFFYLGFGILDPSLQNFVNENSAQKRGGFSYGLMFFSYFGGNIGGNLLITSLGEDYTAQFYFQILIYIILVEWLLQFIFLNDQWHRIIKGKIDQMDKTLSVYSLSGQELKMEILNGKQLAKQPDFHPTQISIVKIIFNNKKVRNSIIFFTMDTFFWGTSLAIYNGGLVANYNLSKEDLAVLLLIFNISNLVLQIPAGHFVDKIGKRKALILSESIGLIFFFLNIVSWLFQDQILMPLLIIAQIMFGFLVALFIPAMFMVTTNLDEHRTAEAYGVVSVVKGLAFMPTGLLGGLLIDHVHYIAPFIFTIVGIFIELWFLVKFYPQD
ncbi:MAG: MFS transporter [Candidatus Lokiarchaeota archaeon]|nr:MFS transporter [Candidatus Harpocratesius repetitus]